MSPIYLYNGKILTKNNAIATSEACCCDVTPTPTPTPPPTPTPTPVPTTPPGCFNVLLLTFVGDEPLPGFEDELRGAGYINIRFEQVGPGQREYYGDCCGELNGTTVVGQPGGYEIPICQTP